MNKTALSILVASTFALSACGGGSDDSADVNPSGGSETELVKITKSNANLITNLGYGAMSGMASAGNVNLNDLSVFESRTTRALDTTPNATGSVPGFGPITVQCDLGGTMTISGVYLNEAQPYHSSGDYVSITTNNCQDWFGEIETGTMKIEVLSYTSDESMTLRTTMDQVTSGDDNYSMKGDLTMVINGETINVTSNSMSGTEEDETYSYKDLDMTIVETDTTLTISMSGEFTSSELGGTVMVSTNPAMSGGVDDYYSTTGKMTFTGADGSFVSMDADTGNMNTVLLTINNGSSTSSEVVTWDSLEDED